MISFKNCLTAVFERNHSSVGETAMIYDGHSKSSERCML